MTEVIVLTAHATVTTAVEAMKLGAYDFLTKPFKIEELKAVIEKAFEKKKILSENLLLKTQIKIQSDTGRIITGNRQMLDILETVKKVATSDLPVLISGESGVGKELVARAVHDESGRAGPFIPINCGAIPETMLESELFGSERGAFTGAQARKLGLLEIADNGSLFLDEIGELPQPLQVKLLRVLETRQFFRIGGVKESRSMSNSFRPRTRTSKRRSEKAASGPTSSTGSAPSALPSLRSANGEKTSPSLSSISGRKIRPSNISGSARSLSKSCQNMPGPGMSGNCKT